ncbi:MULTISPECIES: NAD(P)-binding protein [unclassified Bradyrhizobium]|uniref:FAD-dependent oxidoreductase n=1 Tax=unclassified Bradyrhizobium TaxID=2631580 RepID=UPI001CD762D4|nr:MULTISPECIES: NAD(P)-binding protein [unclassified Bradyrhizobium]MCA1426797.1 NAD(P)-binding protein [Bradyrhizobium sp. NBAIM16]MCA1505584.1 NAD(P)-binding protein [Bradyrhizobium sp. NBAIM02]
MVFLMTNSFDEARYDGVVLGAGISGLVATSILLRGGARKVIVIDEYAQSGGNHIDCKIGDYTFDVGSYIFQDDSPLLAHFPELLPLYIEIHPSWGRLTPQGAVSQYPLSIKDDLLSAGPMEWLRMVGSIVFARTFRRKIRSAKDFATFWIGKRLLERTGLGFYLSRFYGFPADQVDVKFAEKRMLWIKEHATLRNLVARALRRAPDVPPNRQLVRPREGFAFLYQKAVERLEGRGASFVLGAKITGVERQNGDFSIVLANERAIAGRRLVSTVPLARIQDLCGLQAHREMKTVTLLTLFYSFSGKRGFTQSILYNFSREGAWKRLTMHSDFYGKCHGREFFSVEINAEHVAHDRDKADCDFRTHTCDNSLFLGDLRLEGAHVLDNAYPIYTDQADERAGRAVVALRQLGIESIGRQGRFDYQPTARDSTLKAEAALRSD